MTCPYFHGSNPTMHFSTIQYLIGPLSVAETDASKQKQKKNMVKLLTYTQQGIKEMLHSKTSPSYLSSP